MVRKEVFCDSFEILPLVVTDKSIVSMPDLIAHTNMDSQSVSRLREELAKMTQWLSKRIDKYLSADYEHVGQEYQDLAKSNA
jgi:mortality factor 4-like protein 1